jgi:thiol-disulfide isomerase/thioredoxin
MKRIILAVIALIVLCLALVPGTDPGVSAQLHAPFERSAPEFQVADKWVNSKPIRLADLRGKVVLVDFWTYSCINCLRTVPYLNRWHQQYKDQGLVVVGIHTPEFGFEAMPVNVTDAIRRLGIQFPVGQDNKYATWNAYGNRAWPGFYLVDQKGNIVLRRYGEGEYDKIENKIRELLAIKTPVGADNGPDLSRIRSPEMYFGTAHEEFQAAEQQPATGSKTYVLPKTLRTDGFALGGTWSRDGEQATLGSDNGRIVLRFNAAKMHLVAGSRSPMEISVRVDGGKPTKFTVDVPRLYTLFDSSDYREHTMEIEVPSRGIDLYSVTYG